MNRWQGMSDRLTLVARRWTRITYAAGVMLGAMLVVVSCNDPTITKHDRIGPVSRPTVSLMLSDSAAPAGTIVAVSVDIQQPVTDTPSAVPLPIAAFQARLAFASGTLEYVDEGSGDVGTHAINAAGDTVHVAGVSPVTGFADGHLITLRFRVIDSQGLESLRLTIDELTDLHYHDRRAEFLGQRDNVIRVAADVTPSTTNRVYGDATADGVIGASDALAILTTDAGLAPPAGFDSAAADVNTDNLVNALDAQILLASLVGRDVLQFRLGDVVGSARVTMTSVTPDTLRPGMTATIAGVNFSDVAANDTVMLDSIPLAVTTATATQLTVALPSSMTCRATHGAFLTVRVGGSTGARRQMLQTASTRAMHVGDTLVFDSDSAFRCNEFPAGVYFAAVYNSVREATPVLDTFQLITTSGTTITGAPALSTRIPNDLVKSLAPTHQPPPFRWDLVPNGDRTRQRAIAHSRFMERDLQRIQRAKFGPSRNAAPTGSRFRSRFNVNQSIGSYSTMKFLGTTQSGGDTVITISTRTVYAGSRALILEDASAPLAGQMDSYYQKLGNEFESVMYPILTSNFGDPLAMDANLSGAGRVTMLFTPMVAKYDPGAQAFVTVCDFLTPADCPASNLTEVFYSDVPTRLTTTDGSDPNYDERTPAGWYNGIRGTLIHETKHITALAEKFSRSSHPLLEESWLEEGTAQIASELYARTISHVTWKGNAGYDPAMRCEIFLCSGYGFTMWDHFTWLYQYESSANTSSPIYPGWYDGTIYGSAWLLTRWAADTYASNEADFFKTIVQQTTVNGMDNLEARTGQPWSQMLGRWALSLAADHYNGATYATPDFLSWNTRSVFSGMIPYLPGAEASYPLYMPQYGGNASLKGTVATGSASFYDFVFGSKASINIRATATTDLPNTTPLRLAIIRMQ